MSIWAKWGASKGIRILLFWSSWLLLFMLSKRFTSPPGDNVDFLLKNFGTFVVAIIATGVMVHYLPEKTIKLAIGTIWIAVILLVVVL